MAHAKIMKITPQVAQVWLGGNIHNRNLREKAYQAYARDMLQGKWDLNGESIKFSSDGTLIDGQHRLHAVISAGVSIHSLVVFDLDISTQGTVDTGSARTFSDRLGLEGEPHASTLAALLKRIKEWENHEYFGSGWTEKPTHEELAALLEREGDLARISAQEGRNLSKGFILAPSLMSFCHWLFSKVNAEMARWFLGRLADGASLAPDSPVLVLRNRIIKDKQEARGSINSGYTLAMIIIGWNAYRAGQALKIIKIPAGGLTRENYPMPN